MIEYMAVKNGKLLVLPSQEQAEIIRMVAPQDDEIRQVAALTRAPHDYLTAACDRDERPRVETEDEAHLIVLRVPHEPSVADLPVSTVAFGIVLTPSHIISVCSASTTAWEVMARTRPLVPPVDKRLPFLCAWFMGIARLYLTHLHRIRAAADAVEREIHVSMRNVMLIRMLDLEKCLVDFTTSLRGHDTLWSRLKRIQGRPLTEDEQDLIEDVRIEFKQAHDLTEIHSNILSGMMDAFASVISNNLNVVMKLLTSLTIILMLPTLVASVYGMNVKLPFQDSPHAFLITMGMSLVLSVAGVAIFLRKKLL